MPNVVVYVHAEHADKFRDENGERDQAALAEFVREAAKAALAERGDSGAGATGTKSPAPDPPRSTSADPAFRPDPKPSGRRQ